MRDRMPTLWGCLEVTLRRRGRVIDRFAEPNAVVVGSALAVAQLLGGSATSYAITQVGFGTSNSPAMWGNTSLTGAYVKAVDGASYPAPSQVTFAFSLGAAEVVGLSIGEFGLLTAAGTLFARKARATPIVKDNELALSATWTIGS